MKVENKSQIPQFQEFCKRKIKMNFRSRIETEFFQSQSKIEKQKLKDKKLGVYIIFNIKYIR